MVLESALMNSTVLFWRKIVKGFLEFWAGKAMVDKNVKGKADGSLVCEIAEESLRPPLQDFIMDVHVIHLN